MCKLCKTYDFTRIGIDMSSWGNNPTIFFSGGCGQTPNDQRFRYCPMCGEQIIYKEKEEY